MTMRKILSVCAVVLMAGCGEDGAGEVYEIESGTYNITSLSATGTDDCNFESIFPSTITVNVEEGEATHVLGTVDPERNPVTPIDGNTLGEDSKTYTPDNVQAGCTETVTVKVSGTITADNTFEGIASYSSAPAQGSTSCTAAGLEYKKFPCSSTVSFIATKAD